MSQMTFGVLLFSLCKVIGVRCTNGRNRYGKLNIDNFEYVS